MWETQKEDFDLFFFYIIIIFILVYKWLKQNLAH